MGGLALWTRNPDRLTTRCALPRVGLLEVPVPLVDQLDNRSEELVLRRPPLTRSLRERREHVLVKLTENLRGDPGLDSEVR